MIRTVREFADRIQQVAQEAYPSPDIAEQFRQSEMITRFLLGTSSRTASMQSVHKNFTTLDEAVNFVQAFSEHQHALHRKPAAAYASWETDDDPADVLRSQMPLTSG
jgi:hypothetical protein